MAKDKGLTRKLQINRSSGQATITIPSQIVRLKGWGSGQDLEFVIKEGMIALKD